MKVKVQHFSGNITEEEVTPIFKCKHVEDTELYPSLSDVKFDETYMKNTNLTKLNFH